MHSKVNIAFSYISYICVDDIVLENALVGTESVLKQKYSFQMYPD